MITVKVATVTNMKTDLKHAQNTYKSEISWTVPFSFGTMATYRHLDNVSVTYYFLWL